MSLIDRRGLFTSVDFPCPYCGKPIYIAKTGGGKSKHHRLVVTHVHNDSAGYKAAPFTSTTGESE